MADHRDFMDYLGGLETETHADTEKAVERTYHAALKKAGLKRNLNSAKKLGRVLLIAAAVTACAAVTAAASGIDVKALFQGYFEHGGASDILIDSTSGGSHLTQEQIKVLDQSGADIDQRVTDNGMTVTLKAAVCDQSNAYFLLDVAAPEGTVLDRDDYDFQKCDWHFNSLIDSWKDRFKSHAYSVSSSYKVETLQDFYPHDNHKLFMVHLTVVGMDLRGMPIHLTLEGLSVPGVRAVNSGESKYEMVLDPVVKGTWDFRPVTLHNDSCSIDLTVNQATHFDSRYYLNSAAPENGKSNDQCTVNTVRLSSFSAVVEFSSDTATVGFPVPSFLTLHRKDGSQIRINMGEGDGFDGKMSTLYEFNAPIDINSVSSLSIGNLTIPVS